MNAELRIAVAGDGVNLDDLRKAAQTAVDAVGKGAVVTAELRHGNPGMPVIEALTAANVAKTASGLIDENEITQAALKAEQKALTESGKAEAEKAPPVKVLEGAAVTASPRNETEREAAKVQAGAATADAAGIPAVKSAEEENAERLAAEAKAGKESDRLVPRAVSGDKAADKKAAAEAKAAGRKTAPRKAVTGRRR